MNRHRLLLPLLLAIALAAPVAASSGEPPVASAAKKKCKKGVAKCAPKRLHLSITGRYGVLTYSAEVELEINRKNFARVEYSQAGGKSLTVSAHYQGFPLNIDMCSESRFDVNNQTRPIPKRGLFGDFDFAAFFGTNDKGKWEYAISPGNPYGSESFEFPGTETCIDGTSAGATAPFTFYFHGPLVDTLRPGKPGQKLSGRATQGVDFADWALRPAK